MSVSDLMSRGLVTARPDEPVSVVAKRMHNAGVGAVVVLDEEGKLLGLFTERDLLRLVAEEASLDKPVGEEMTVNPTVVKPDTPILEAGSLMVQLGVRHLPVVDDDGRPLGILSLRDVCQSLLAQE